MMHQQSEALRLVAQVLARIQARQSPGRPVFAKLGRIERDVREVRDELSESGR